MSCSRFLHGWLGRSLVVLKGRVKHLVLPFAWGDGRGPCWERSF